LPADPIYEHDALIKFSDNALATTIATLDAFNSSFSLSVRHSAYVRRGRKYSRASVHDSPAVQSAPPTRVRSFIRNAAPSPIPGVVTMKLRIVRNVTIARSWPAPVSRSTRSFVDLIVSRREPLASQYSRAICWITSTFFADGLHEEMIFRLGRMQSQRLAVIARTSVMPYRDAPKSIAVVARELGVDFVLEGNVRHAGERFRITAQLIRANDQSHLWTESYDRSWKDIFAIQSDVGARVADSLAVELLPSQAAAGNENGNVSPTCTSTT
jgi:TolB-like protein